MYFTLTYLPMYSMIYMQTLSRVLKYLVAMNMLIFSLYLLDVKHCSVIFQETNNHIIIYIKYKE